MLRKPEAGYPGLIVSLAVLIVAMLAMTDNSGYQPVSEQYLERSWSNATSPYQFTDPAVVKRAQARRQDTRELHIRSCKEDPRGYDCIESGKMLARPTFLKA